MATIIVSDVFGLTPALKTFANEVKASAILDPYCGQTMGFKNEEEAYTFFITRIGLESYLSVLSSFLDNQETDIILIGFSIGASIIWNLSGQTLNNQRINKGICFYGSQIRNFTKIQPQFPIQMILPSYEPHFNIKSLAHQLANKEHTQVSQSKYLHGFMNKYSVNFNQTGYEQQLATLKRDLRLEE